MVDKNNDDINERRRKRIREQCGITESGGSPPESLIGEYGDGYISTVIPSKDFSPEHNYKAPMWEIIKDHFKGEPKIAMEVGARRGHWAAGLMKNTKKTKLFCVDPWAGRMGRNNLKYWFKRLGDDVFRRVFPLVGTSLDWSWYFPFQVDLLFIDGLHDAKSVTLDLERWSTRVLPGGLIIGHDYNQPDVKAAVDKFFPDLTGTQKLGPQHAVSFWKAV